MYSLELDKQVTDFKRILTGERILLHIAFNFFLQPVHLLSQLVHGIVDALATGVSARHAEGTDRLDILRFVLEYGNGG